MSEYQYYDFIAMDRDLTEKERGYVESVSTRANVSGRRWRNEYNYGDFRGSVDKMMQIYDAHVYVSNFGSYYFMLRLPDDLMPLGELVHYEDGAVFSVRSVGKSLVLRWDVESEGEDGWVEGEGVLDGLIGVRDELLQGDTRPLYLGWLAGLHDDEAEDDDKNVAPPVPAGMGNLTSAQQAFAEFLRVDRDFIAAAASVSGAASDVDGDLEGVLSSMEPVEMRELLLRVAHGEGGKVAAELKRRGKAQAKPTDKALSCHDLRQLAEKERVRRLARAAEEKEKKRREKEKRRQAHLQEVLNQTDSYWEKADTAASLGKSSSYEEASRLLHDLAAAYDSAGKKQEFNRRYVMFTKQHASRKALLRRLTDLCKWQNTD